MTFVTSVLASDSKVTWKTYSDRAGLSTIKYPSNWNPQGVAQEDKEGPIDYILASPGTATGWVEIHQSGSASPYNTDSTVSAGTFKFLG